MNIAIPVVLGSLCALGALALQPPPPPPEDPFPPPAPLAVTRAIALGRTHAAADLLWLRTIQMVGHPDADARAYPHVDEWIDHITTLDTRFDYPYAFAAVLLATSEPERLRRVDRMLERAEREQPNSYWFPMHRGFVAYFGLLDRRAAAAHMLRATGKPGAPEYLPLFARRLEKAEQSCAQMSQALTALSQQQSTRDAKAMQDRQLAIISHCLSAQFKGLRASHRTKGQEVTLEELVASGEMPTLPAILGRCWRADPTGIDRLLLEECGEPSP